MIMLSDTAQDDANARKQLTLTIQETTPVLVMALHGELDIATLAICRQDMSDALDAFTPDAPMRMVLDLSECTYVDSIGLGFFVWLMKRARSRGGAIVFAALPARVLRLLQVTSLTEVLTITQTKEQAKAIIEQL
jgi:anti-anti-sigma factor